MATLEEKYAALQSGKRKRRGTVYLTNARMSESAPDHPVLIEVPEDHWNNKQQPYQKRGYTQYKPAVKATAPVEAKKVEPKP